MSSLARLGRIRSYRQVGCRVTDSSATAAAPRMSSFRQPHRQSWTTKLQTNVHTTSSRGRRRFNMSTSGNHGSSSSMRQSTTMASNLGLNRGRTESVTFGLLYRNWKTVLEEVLSKPRTVPIPRWISPNHNQVTASECFGHASFVLVAASYAVDDFLLLRIIAVAGSTSMLFFAYFHPHGRVLWLPFKWNVLFIAINSYRIGMVYWNRYSAERLSQELMELRRKTFHMMDPVDYFRLMRIAEIKEYKKGDLILAQGEHVRYVRLVLHGQLRALRDGKLNYLLEEGNFISEIGIHAGLLLPGKIESCCTIVADGDGKGGDITRVLCWDRTELVHLMELYQGVRRSLKSILSWDIVRKLKAQRLLLVEHLIDDPEEWTARRNRQTNHRYAAILQAVLHKQQYLQKFRNEINKYRTIHHIDDEHHAMALAECGWTVEEFEAGVKKRKAVRKILLIDGSDHEEDGDEDDDFEEIRDWQWYMQDIYLRFFG